MSIRHRVDFPALHAGQDAVDGIRSGRELGHPEPACHARPKRAIPPLESLGNRGARQPDRGTADTGGQHYPARIATGPDARSRCWERGGWKRLLPKAQSSGNLSVTPADQEDLPTLTLIQGARHDSE